MLGAALMGGISMPASASPWTNYFPAAYADDNGTELFTPGPSVIGVKLFDLIGDTSPITSFGFYFPNNPGVLYPLWNAGAPTNTIVSIDFVNGFAVDTATSTLTAIFEPTTAPIGFYETFGDPAVVTLYTEAAISPSGFDYAGTFPLLGDPSSYLITFNLPGDGGETLLSMLVVSPVTAAVAEPASLALLALAAAPLLRRRRATAD